MLPDFTLISAEIMGTQEYPHLELIVQIAQIFLLNCVQDKT